MERSGIRKLLRSPSLKRKNKTLPLNERCTLERVLGVCVSSTCGLTVDPLSGTIAYPAGCVVVLYNPKKNRQSHIFNRCKKAITCVDFSSDGKHLVTGECGHQPAVRVWDVEEKTQVAEFLGHKFGINCVAFTPNMKYIVSVGTQHDMGINVYNWRTNLKVASNKVASKVSDIAFNEGSSMFVTAGHRHVKFWYMDSSKSRINQTVPLLGRSGILGEQKNNYFCSVACGRGSVASSTFVITQSGLLCEFNDKRMLIKWVELKTTLACSLSLSDDKLFIGCASGVVRTFDAKTLSFITTLPHPHHLGVDVAGSIDHNFHLPEDRASLRYPDTTAVCYDRENQRLTCVYNDHSMYIWDVQNMTKVGKVRSFLYHSGSIWGLEMYPSLEASERALPAGSFITSSSDDTVRVWNLDSHMDTSSSYKRNIHCNELLKVVYVDKELTYLQDKEYNPAGKTDKTDTGFQEKSGVRCVRISPDGQELASGDRIGNIRIHEVSSMEQSHIMEAHDSEILCLEFCKPQLGVRLLASAGRDRLLHIFDRDQDYGLVQTLDDHSASITAVRFLESEQEGQLLMVSCGADKSLLFRTAQQDPEFQFVLQRHMVGKTTLYDMDVDPSGKFLATACQDRQIRIYSVKSGKQKKSYNGSVGTEGVLITVCLDPSGSYVATSCDKNVSVYNFFTGECVATMSGHSEVITCVKFTNDFKHIISVAGDGCIFVWRLPPEIAAHMSKRKGVLPVCFNNDVDKSPTKSHDAVDAPILQSIPEQLKPGYKFSVGQLPTWAKRQVLQETPNQPADPLSESNTSMAPRGCWAQRAGHQGALASVLDESTIKFGPDDEPEPRRFTIEESPDRDPVSPARSSVAIINDDEFNQEDEEEEEDEFSVMAAKEGEPSSPMQVQDKVRWTRGSEAFTLPEFSSQASLDEEADVGVECTEEGDATEDNIIFYPEKDDLQDTQMNSFRVFEGDKASVADTSSDLADPDDLSDDEASSAPTSPDPSSSSTTEEPPPEEEEKFLKANFEALERLEAEDESRLMNPRLSISSRFLSRTHQQYLRNIAKEAGSPSSILQKRRSDMARAVEETRRRLKAMGWKITGRSGGGKDDTSLTKDNPMHPPINEAPPTNMEAPPTKPEAPPTKSSVFSLAQSISLKDEESGTPDTGTPPPEETFVTHATTPERKKWTVPNVSTTQDVAPRKWKSLLDVAGGLKSPNASPRLQQRSTTPNPAPSRTLPSTPTDQGGLYFTLPQTRRVSSPSPLAMVVGGHPKLTVATSQDRSQASTDQDSQTGSEASSPSHSTKQSSTTSIKSTTQSKRRSLPPAKVVMPSYRQGTVSANAKSTKEAIVKKPKEGEPSSARFRKGKLSGSVKSKYKSTPNLAQLAEGDPATGVKSSKTADDIANLRRSMPPAKDKNDLGFDSITGETKSLTGGIGGLTKETREGEPDNMPPPATTTVPTSRHNATKKSRRTTMPELTLSQAKQILMNSDVKDRDLGLGSSLETDRQSDSTPSSSTEISPPRQTDVKTNNKTVTQLDPHPMDLPERDTTVKPASLNIPAQQPGHLSSTPPRVTHLSSVNRTFPVEGGGEPDHQNLSPPTQHTTKLTLSPIKPSPDSPTQHRAVSTQQFNDSPSKGKMGRREILSTLTPKSPDSTTRQTTPPERLSASVGTADVSSKSATLPRLRKSSGRAQQAMDDVQKLQQKAAQMQQQWEKRRSGAATTSISMTSTSVTVTSHSKLPPSSPSYTSYNRGTEFKETVQLSKTIDFKQVTSVNKNSAGPAVNGLPHEPHRPPSTQAQNIVNGQMSTHTAPTEHSQHSVNATSTTAPDASSMVEHLAHCVQQALAMHSQLSQNSDEKSRSELEALESGLRRSRDQLSQVLGPSAARFSSFLHDTPTDNNNCDSAHLVGQKITDMMEYYSQELLQLVSSKVDHSRAKCDK